jgi:hypothetical protein
MRKVAVRKALSQYFNVWTHLQAKQDQHQQYDDVYAQPNHFVGEHAGKRHDV